MGAGVDVSDHALLRYLERVKGVDVESARAEIIDICAVAAALGADCKAHDRHIYVLDGYWVTTVLPKDGPFRRRRRRYPDQQSRGPFGNMQRRRVK